MLSQDVCPSVCLSVCLYLCLSFVYLSVTRRYFVEMVKHMGRLKMRERKTRQHVTKVENARLENAGPVCMGMEHAAPVCSGMENVAPVCRGMENVAPVCSGMENVGPNAMVRRKCNNEQNCKVNNGHTLA